MLREDERSQQGPLAVDGQMTGSAIRLSNSHPLPVIGGFADLTRTPALAILSVLFCKEVKGMTRASANPKGIARIATLA